jgi:hypothetical protein
MINYILLIHIIGLIIGLGAVTVIDILGYKARKSKQLTQVTIHAHHTTKPLIWIGTILVLISWIFLYQEDLISNIKTIILTIMIVNGAFLSFYVSPKLNELIGKDVLLPNSLQTKIIISMIISFLSWWIFVVLTVIKLS